MYRLTTFIMLAVLLIVASFFLGGIQLANNIGYRKDQFIDYLKPKPKGRHRAYA